MENNADQQCPIRTPKPTPGKTAILFSKDNIFRTPVGVIDLCNDDGLPKTLRSPVTPTGFKEEMPYMTPKTMAETTEGNLTTSSIPSRRKCLPDLDESPKTPTKIPKTFSNSRAGFSSGKHRLMDQLMALKVNTEDSKATKDTPNRPATFTTRPIPQKTLGTEVSTASVPPPQTFTLVPPRWTRWTSREYVALAEALFASFPSSTFAADHGKNIQEVQAVASAVIFRPLLDAAESIRRGEAGIQRLTDLFEKYGGKSRVWSESTLCEVHGVLNEVGPGVIRLRENATGDEIALSERVLGKEDWEFLNGVLIGEYRNLLNWPRDIIPNIEDNPTGKQADPNDTLCSNSEGSTEKEPLRENLDFI